VQRQATWELGRAARDFIAASVKTSWAALKPSDVAFQKGLIKQTSSKRTGDSTITDRTIGEFIVPRALQFAWSRQSELIV